MRYDMYGKIVITEIAYIINMLAKSLKTLKGAQHHCNLNCGKKNFLSKQNSRKSLNFPKGKKKLRCGGIHSKLSTKAASPLCLPYTTRCNIFSREILPRKSGSDDASDVTQAGFPQGHPGFMAPPHWPKKRTPDPCYKQSLLRGVIVSSRDGRENVSVFQLRGETPAKLKKVLRQEPS